MAETESFGQWLRHRRREIDLTQEELARQVGCAPITVRKIEADQTRPSKQLARLLMEQLQVAADEREDFISFARGGELAKSIKAVEPRDNLPHPVSSLIGRGREIGDVKRLMNLSRLVTLTGAGGCGKSRLAIESARQMLDLFPDGIWFVAFAPLSDSTLIHQTIASAFRVREDPDRPLIETLCVYLHSKHLLLIFDNCEHLIEECAQAADTLLRACPQLCILATSREALRIEGEEQYYVPCLSLPKAGAEIPIERLNQFEAVCLFVDRAALVQPTFALTAENSSPISRICQHLDGMPLAIELAAARTKLLTVRHIAEHLEDRFTLLTSGNRTALPRQQTLRATIEWSYELLPERARLLFRRLSVFAGGFTQGSAQAVCSDNGLALDEVLDELSRLVDRSLVEVVQAGDAERYRMLETIRQYARERLKESDEELQVRDRHLGYFMDWTEEVEPKLRGPEQTVWWDRIEIEHDNIRTALEWSLSGGDVESGLRLAGAAFWYWQPRGYWREGLKWLKDSLVRIGQEQWTLGRAKAVVEARYFAQYMSAASGVDDRFEESIEYLRKRQDGWWTAFALDCLGWNLLYARDTASARARFHEAVELARATQEAWILGNSLRGLGAALVRFDYSAARPVLEESVSLLRVAGDGWALAYALNQLGISVWGQSDYAEATLIFEEALNIYEKIGERAMTIQPFFNLACMMLAQGNGRRAEELFREALVLAKNVGFSTNLGLGLIGFGDLAAFDGHPRRSAILLAAGENYLNSIDKSIAIWPWVVTENERYKIAARTQLGEAAFAEATAEGRAMTLEQAIEFALETTQE